MSCLQACVHLKSNVGLNYRRGAFIIFLAGGTDFVTGIPALKKERGYARVLS